MASSKFKYAFVALYLLVIVQFSSSFKIGSRGLNEMDMARDIETEHEAGNKNGHEKLTYTDSNKSNRILKSFTNKEYLYGDDSSEEKPNKISTETVNKGAAISANALEFGNLLKSNKVDKGSRENLKREQRTNSQYDEDAYNKKIENFIYDLFKLNKLQEDFGRDYGIDYEEFLNDLNSEDRMKMNEIKGQDYSGEYFPDYSFVDAAYRELKHETQNDFDSDFVKVQKPIIHYKETLISGDIYNKKIAEEDDDFKQMSESPNVSKYPGLMKNDKLNYENSLSKEKLIGMENQKDYLFVSVIAGCTLAGLLAIIAGGVCLYTIKRKDSGIDGKQFFGSAGMTKSGSVKSNSSNSSGDRRLAQSAQMFHYQHQKQQMIAMEKANNDTKQDQSDNSEGETEEGDYTVYECPGLAPTGEMEVKNPLFKEEFPSSTNLTSSNSVSSMPPAYSTISSEAKSSQQTEIAAEKTNLIEVNETVKSDVQKPESSSSATSNVNNSETSTDGTDKQ